MSDNELDRQIAEKMVMFGFIDLNVIHHRLKEARTNKQGGRIARFK